jgi:hypothetical protein
MPVRISWQRFLVIALATFLHEYIVLACGIFLIAACPRHLHSGK